MTWKIMNLFDIVMKLNGQVTAVGEHNTDKERYDNLISLIDLTDQLLVVIQQASFTKDRLEASMAKLGKRADEFIEDIKG